MNIPSGLDIYHENENRTQYAVPTLRGTGSGKLAPWKRLFAHCNKPERRKITS